MSESKLNANRPTVNFPVNPAKATEAVARLLEKSGADVDYLRIIKLAYLADRASLAKRGMPIIGGHYYSMRKGPTIGEVMTFVNARSAPGWKERIRARRGNLMNLVAIPAFQELAEAEIQILDSVVQEHFHRSTEDLVTWCHEKCPEYEHVSFFERRPIEVETLLKAAGWKDAEVAEALTTAREIQNLDALLA